ncbi:MAG: PBP1A family penicillin-binding protein [Lachnospiraceae bacterium]|nr:PBP1A family penicillin-binding protein [Lachnospiraceae bacterium]
MTYRKKKKKKYRLFWFFAKLQIVLILFVFAAVGYYYYGGYATQVQRMQKEAIAFVKESTEDTFKSAQTSVVYDKHGDTISTLKGEKDVYYLSYEKIPVDACAAIVSIEDKKFYQHNGIDFKAILRAIKAMIENGEVTQGASTITQQLARNIFLTQDRVWQRKIEEMFIATELEKKYSKTQILEFYMNNIYFGNGYYGIQAASQGYFNADAEDLSLTQLAFLCAIPNNPTLYDPLTNMENTISRRNRILKNMYEDGKITQNAYLLAQAEEITLNRPEHEKNNYVETYTYNCAIRLLMQKEGFEFKTAFLTDSEKEAYEKNYDQLYAECQKRLFTAGYRIYTSIDLDMQEMLQNSVDNTLLEFTELSEEGIYKLQSASVCIDNETGYVAAIIGGRSQDFDGYTLNRAYQSYRQPGSVIKPIIVYAPAIEAGYTPETIVLDEKIEDGPVNADGVYSGEITLRESLAESKNTVAWQLFEEVTPKVGMSYLKAMNFAKIAEEQERLALSLGGFTHGVSAVEMAAAYAAIENDGNYRMPTCIVKITDAEGNEILSTKQEEKRVYRTTAARMTTSMMESVMTEGTGEELALQRMPSAGKTGTTNDNKDGWFVGYTRYYTTSVWVGYDMPEELPGLTGSSYPGEIWKDFMEKCHRNLIPAEFLPYLESEKQEKIREDALGIEDEEKAEKEADAQAKEKTDEEKAEENTHDREQSEQQQIEH